MFAEAFSTDLSEKMDFCSSRVWTGCAEHLLHVTVSATRGRQSVETIHQFKNLRAIQLLFSSSATELQMIT